MDWKKLIQDLSDAGFSQRKIASHIGVSQARVAVIAKGGTTVSYEVGDKLIALWKVKVKYAA